MSINSIFGGLSDNVFLYGSYDVLKYVLLLVVLDSISGYYSLKAVTEGKLFRLIRYGWRKWYQKIVKVNLVLTSMGALLLFLFSCGHFPETNLWAAFMVFLLNINLLATVQTTIILSSNRAVAGYAVVALIQLASLFFSQGLHGYWKILLPGNWGCINRSDVIVQDGFPLYPVIVMEVMGILVLYLFGWQVVKFLNRGQKVD